LPVSQGEAQQGLQASAHERLFHEGKPMSLLHKSGFASAAIAAVTLATMNAGEVDYTFAGDAVANAGLDNTWLGEVGVGCGSVLRGVRGEAMVVFRGKRDFDGEPTPYQVV
jgi:hypothetical protein